MYAASDVVPDTLGGIGQRASDGMAASGASDKMLESVCVYGMLKEEGREDEGGGFVLMHSKQEGAASPAICRGTALVYIIVT